MCLLGAGLQEVLRGVLQEDAQHEPCWFDTNHLLSKKQVIFKGYSVITLNIKMAMIFHPHFAGYTCPIHCVVQE